MTQPAAIHTVTLRCSHRLRASGRQCRSLATASSSLCAHHLAKQKVREKDSDFAKFLFSRANGLKTAQGINHSLTYLYELLACDQISVRRAQALAYITSLVLRTLPAIDDENSRGMGSAAYQAALAKRGGAATASSSNSAHPDQALLTKRMVCADES